MSNYTKSTNFATKDNLTPGDPLKVVRGTEIDTEFNNIATAVATKTDNSAAAITGGSITGITDLAIADGGTGASTAAGALNNLLPSQTSAANKYLQSDGTNASWDAVTLSTADITGTLPVANGGTGVTSSTGTGNVVLSNSPTLVTPALGTPASGVATNLTGLPISTGVSGLGTGVATFLGTPSSTNLISAVTDETGTGSLVFATSPTLVTPILGTPTSATLTNATGLPIATGVSGLGTGVATFLATPSSANLAAALTDETGSGANVFATSPTLVTPILGTPTSATLTNATGLPLTTGVTGTLPTANGGTNLTSFTSGGVVYASSTSALATGSALTFDGTTLINSSGAFSGKDNLTLTASVNVTNGTVVDINSAGTSGVTKFSINNTETMRLNSTGLGIGTTSPGTVLNVVGASGIRVRGANSASDGAFDIKATNTSVILNANTFGSSVPMLFQNSGTTQMTLSTAGNLGIGTSSPSYKLDAQTTATGTAAGDNTVAFFGSQASGRDANIRFGDSVNASARIGYLSGSLYFYTNSVERARIPLNGGFQSKTTISVGDATPSSSGAGITFPATQSASSDANTLDDYEEGSWTPSVGGTATYSVQEGRYVKVGQLVYLQCKIEILLLGTGSTTTISGLPFTSLTTTFNSVGTGAVNYFGSLATSVTTLVSGVQAGATTINFGGLTAAGTSMTGGITVFGNSARIDFSIVYRAAS